MLIFLVSTIAAGFAAWGIAMAVNRLTGRKLPKWTLPAGAGLAMITFVLWNEYSWAERSRSALSDTAVITFKNERRDFWRPWTFLAPLTTRMSVLDRGAAAELPADPNPDMRHARVYLMERWKPTYGLTMLYDCARARRLDTSDAGASNANIEEADWIQLDPEDPALRAACGGGGNG